MQKFNRSTRLCCSALSASLASQSLASQLRHFCASFSASSVSLRLHLPLTQNRHPFAAAVRKAVGCAAFTPKAPALPLGGGTL